MDQGDGHPKRELYVVAWEDARLTFALFSVCDVENRVGPPQSNVGHRIYGGRVELCHGCEGAGTAATAVRVMPRGETKNKSCALLRPCCLKCQHCFDLDEHLDKHYLRA